MLRLFTEDIVQGSLKDLALIILRYISKHFAEITILFALVVALTIKNPGADYAKNSFAVICVLLLSVYSLFKNKDGKQNAVVEWIAFAWLALLLVNSLLAPLVTFPLIYASFLAFIPLLVSSRLFSSLDLELLYKWLKVLAVLIAAFCLHQLWSTGERANFLVIDPNFVGGILGFFFIAFYFEFLEAPSRKKIILSLLLSVIIAFGIAATKSRSALVLIVFSCFLYAFLLRNFELKKRVFVALGLLVIIFAAWSVIEFIAVASGEESVIASRVATAGSSMGVRFEIWEAAFHMFMDDPVWGKGLGSFYTFYPEYRTELFTAGTFAHNDYLQFFSEGGVFLGVFYLLLCFGYFVVFAKNLWQENISTVGDRKNRCHIAVQAGTLFLMAQAGVNFIFYIAGSSLLLALGFSSLAYTYANEQVSGQTSKNDLSIWGKLPRVFAAIFAVIFIAFNASLWFSSSAAFDANILTKLNLKLTEEQVADLEMHVDLNPFIYRPLMPLSENALLSVGGEMSKDERLLLKQRMVKYYNLTAKHLNLRCLNGLLAADFAAEFPEEKGLMPGTREQILQQTYEVNSKCELYYDLLIGSPVPLENEQL